MKRIVGLFFFAILSLVLTIAGLLLFPIVILLLPFYLFLSKKSNEEVRKNSILYAFYLMCIKNKTLFVAFYLIPISMGIYFTYQASVEMVLAYQSREWSTVKGKIVRSWFTTNNDIGSSPRVGGVGASSIEIEYEYSVSGQKLIGQRVMYGYINNYYTSDTYRRKKVYPKDKEVKVYHDPDNPAEAVLERGFYFPYSFNKLFVAWFFLIPLFLILKYYRLYREEDEIRDKEK